MIEFDMAVAEAMCRGLAGKASFAKEITCARHRDDSLHRVPHHEGIRHHGRDRGQAGGQEGRLISWDLASNHSKRGAATWPPRT
jgi:hypothetical protein